MNEWNVNYAEHSPKRLFGHFSADSEMHQSFETPHPAIRAWAGHSLFMQVKVSEVRGSRGQKWEVHSPGCPCFQYMVLPL